MKNIYVYLNQIDFEKQCENLTKALKTSNCDYFVCQQGVFHIIKEIYNIILLEEMENEKRKNGSEKV